MPKKKLTKAQVKRKFKTCTKAIYDLFLDKFGHPDSFVPMSQPAILKLNNDLNNALKRIK
jgi:hypothetical protein